MEKVSGGKQSFSSSLFTKIVLVGLEEFPRLVGQFEAVHRGGGCGGMGQPGDGRRGQQRRRKPASHAVDDTAAAAGGPVAVVGRVVHIPAVGAAGLGMRGTEVAELRGRQ